MILQTIWQGCDSALAAPLVLDLARLTARAHETGRSGPLDALGFYFKDPVGEGPSGLSEQYEELVRFGRSLGQADGEGRAARSVTGPGRTGEAL
jgi:myo-inositol-1-phosphate synthase